MSNCKDKQRRRWRWWREINNSSQVVNQRAAIDHMRRSVRPFNQECGRSTGTWMAICQFAQKMSELINEMTGEKKGGQGKVRELSAVFVEDVGGHVTC